jgi:DNA-binding MarR family transcriptional regulator
MERRHAVEQETDNTAELAAELRSMLKKLKRRLQEQGGKNDLKPSQTAVILRLERDGPSAVSTLARGEEMRPQSMSAIIEALRDLGLVEGIADPNDGRQTLMTLTRKCRAWLKNGRAARQDWLTNSIQKKLSQSEQETLSKALRLLARFVAEE